MTLTAFARTLAATAAAALLSTLSGCAIGRVDLSGPVNQPNVTAHATISGKVIGGQNPVIFSSVNLFAVDNTAYGGGPHALTTALTGSSQYYPGGTTGCSPAPLTATTYTIAAGTATFLAPNTMVAGQLIAIADSAGSGLNGTYLVTTRSAASFSVATSSANAAGATSGTFTPTCYSLPTTDQNGNFTVTGDFACGAYGASVVYLQAFGGNPGLSPIASTNSSLVLTALLQSSASSTTALTCSQLSNANSVNVNELTTAAMGIAMGQFFTATYGGAPSTEGFGSGNSTQAQVGLTNAANTALELVATATGTAKQPYTLTSGSYSVNVAPESLKLQTIANILATCVNGATGNGNCTTIFGALKLAGAATPTDTLQAAVLFGINPTAGGAANMAALFGQASATAAPFLGLATQPADWTIGISYTDANPACTTGDLGTCVLNDPQEVLIDAAGNVWVLNHNGSTAASVSELTPVGAPLLNVDKVGTTSLNTLNPGNMALDTNGNAWLGTTTTSEVFEIGPGGTNAMLTTTSQPYALVIDGGNNVYFGFAGTSATSTVEEFSLDNLAAGSQIEFPILCSTTTYQYTQCGSRTPAETNAFLPQYGAIDTNGNLWFSGGANSPTNSILIMSEFGYGCPVFPCLNGTGGDTVNEKYTILAGGTSGLPTFATPFGFAAGPSGSIWMANTLTGNNTLAEMTSTSTGGNYGSATTLNQPYDPAVDGAGNAWVTNHAGSSVSEFQGTGTGAGKALSPTATGTAPYTVPGFSHAGILTPFGLSIDPSGNVWIANNTANTATASYGIFEIVGAAAPTAAPIAGALKNHKVGAKP